MTSNKQSRPRSDSADRHSSETQTSRTSMYNQSMASTGITPHRDKLLVWYHSMSFSDRLNIMSIADHQLCSLVLDMYRRQQSRGKGCFFQFHDTTGTSLTRSTSQRSLSHDYMSNSIANAFRDNVHDSTSFHHTVHDSGPNTLSVDIKLDDQLFYHTDSIVQDRINQSQQLYNVNATQRQQYTSQQRTDAEHIIECNLRLMDTLEYCNTLTFSQLIMYNSTDLFDLFNQCTNNQFLSQPCLAEFDNKTKKYHWDVPTWFSVCGYYSLATFVIAKFEQTLWIQYFQQTQTDARKSSSTSWNSQLAFKHAKSNQDKWKLGQTLQQVQLMSDFWCTMSADKRNKLLIELQNIVYNDIKKIDTAYNTNSIQSVPDTLLQQLKPQGNTSHHSRSRSLSPQRSPPATDDTETSVSDISQSLSNATISVDASVNLLTDDQQVDDDQHLLQQLNQLLHLLHRLQQSTPDRSIHTNTSSKSLSTTSTDTLHRASSHQSEPVQVSRSNSTLSNRSSNKHTAIHHINSNDQSNINTVDNHIDQIKHHNFIEYLLSSTLSRADTVYDKKLRALSKVILSAYAVTLEMDLFSADDSNNMGAMQKQHKKNKKKSSKPVKKLLPTIATVDTDTDTNVNPRYNTTVTDVESIHNQLTESQSVTSVNALNSTIKLDGSQPPLVDNNVVIESTPAKFNDSTTVSPQASITLHKRAKDDFYTPSMNALNRSTWSSTPVSPTLNRSKRHSLQSKVTVKPTAAPTISHDDTIPINVLAAAKSTWATKSPLTQAASTTGNKTIQSINHISTDVPADNSTNSTDTVNMTNNVVHNDTNKSADKIQHHNSTATQEPINYNSVSATVPSHIPVQRKQANKHRGNHRRHQHNRPLQYVAPHNQQPYIGAPAQLNSHMQLHGQSMPHVDASIALKYAQLRFPAWLSSRDAHLLSYYSVSNSKQPPFLICSICSQPIHAPQNAARCKCDSPHPVALSVSDMVDTRKLHDEILLYCQYVQTLNQQRKPLLDDMISRISTIIHSIWSHVQVVCYGSYSTGLSLPSSDLDLVILRLQEDRQAALLVLASKLRKQHTWIQSVNAIHTAKVPVIKVSGLLDGCHVVVDITFDNDAVKLTAIPPFVIPNGIQSVTLAPHKLNGDAIYPLPTPMVKFDYNGVVQPNQDTISITNDRIESVASTVIHHTDHTLPTDRPITHTGMASVQLVQHYMNTLPALKPLSLIIKQFLFESGLSNTYTGGLNSYCLILMIVAFLQTRYSHIQPATHQTQHMNGANELPNKYELTEKLHNTLPAFNRRTKSMDESNTEIPSPVKHNTNNTSHSVDTNQQSTQSSTVTSADELGTLLLQFLDFYTYRFDFQTMGIAVVSQPVQLESLPIVNSKLNSNSHATVPIWHAAASRSFYFPLLPPFSRTLVISDPFYPIGQNNIGKSVFAFWRLQALFRDKLIALTSRFGVAPTLLSRVLHGPLPQLPAHQFNSDSATVINIAHTNGQSDGANQIPTIKPITSIYAADTNFVATHAASPLRQLSHRKNVV